jgi:hypothetical protein
MDEDRFNIALRKFLKVVGITSQREIERVVRECKGRRHGTQAADDADGRKRAAQPYCRRDDRPSLTSLDLLRVAARKMPAADTGLPERRDDRHREPLPTHASCAGPPLRLCPNFAASKVWSAICPL